MDLVAPLPNRIMAEGLASPLTLFPLTDEPLNLEQTDGNILMAELVPSEIIEKLEERHERLIVELDELNDRLEKALNSFARPSVENDPSAENGPSAENDEVRMTSAESMATEA